MRVIVLTSNYYLAANVALKAFLKHKLLRKHKIEVTGIIAVSNAGCSAKTIKKGWNFINRSGSLFFLKVILLSIWQKWIIKFARFFVPNSVREFFEIEELAEHHNIAYLETDNINSQEVYDFIHERTPDYLVSSLLLQIIKPHILALPTKGGINFHPALFKDHRGTFANFWTIFKNLRHTGATVHFMTDKVDDGKIIVQRKFMVKKSDTMFDVNIKSAQLGGNLLAKALVKLNKNEARGILPKRWSRMFTVPTWQEVREFVKKGKEFIKSKDLFRI
ncbi:MAG: formyltransferase family protein [Patescibacteria group bacterium]